MTSRTPSVFAALCALTLFAGCDFDAAWESWCARTDCQVEPPDAGSAIPSLCRQGRGCQGTERCIYLGPGNGTCLPSCTGYPGGCGAGADCKLLMNEDQAHLVPVCTAFGAETGACSGVEECAEFRTCANGTSGFACLELCSPYHTACVLDLPAGADAGPPCFNDGTMPDGWGVCRQ
ncbi:MAG: hypothetical protein QM765_28240 [Myxococcales bacterium]